MLKTATIAIRGDLEELRGAPGGIDEAPSEGRPFSFRYLRVGLHGQGNHRVYKSSPVSIECPAVAYGTFCTPWLSTECSGEPTFGLLRYVRMSEIGPGPFFPLATKAEVSCDLVDAMSCVGLDQVGRWRPSPVVSSPEGRSYQDGGGRQPPSQRPVMAPVKEPNVSSNSGAHCVPLPALWCPRSENVSRQTRPKLDAFELGGYSRNRGPLNTQGRSPPPSGTPWAWQLRGVPLELF